jgi:hypothetical protein
MTLEEWRLPTRDPRGRGRPDAARRHGRATRPKVERKLGHLVHRTHGRLRARVRGKDKVDADFNLLAARPGGSRQGQMEEGGHLPARQVVAGAEAAGRAAATSRLGVDRMGRVIGISFPGLMRWPLWGWSTQPYPPPGLRPVARPLLLAAPARLPLASVSVTHRRPRRGFRSTPPGAGPSTVLRGPIDRPRRGRRRRWHHPG